MEQKINIAELLKACPKGMELDCTMYDNVVFECVKQDEPYPINVKIKEPPMTLSLSKTGGWNSYDSAKCVIFPKGKTTWDEFVPPCKFKDGDIVYVKTINHHEYILIFKEIKNDHIHKYVCFTYQRLSIDKCPVCLLADAEIIRLTTEEERQELFDTIKANGYHWNADTKTLEKLSVPSTPEKFYIRIGEIPSDEKSSVHRGDVVVGYEDGVSVYDCVETDGLYRIVMPFPLKEGQGMTYECLIQEITQCRYEIENPRNVYLVSGIEVGKGHDNEPVIKNVKILKDLTEQFNTKNDNTEETKTLEKLVIKPKFKVGDKIRHKINNDIYEISAVYDGFYGLVDYAFMLNMKYQDDYELVQNKFDVTTLKPFDKVLVRDDNTQRWTADLFSFYDGSIVNPYSCIGHYTNQCIPYECNEHLLGTTDDCDDFYKTWE